jgi:hypothetical protein
MPYQERAAIYKKIEVKRGCPLISYITSLRPNIEVQMASDAISEIAKQIQRIPKTSKEIDFLIISNGGDPIVSWRIISMLRERFKKVGVLLPYVAYSAATLLALGADEIIMHPFSNLGPVDPQLVYKKKSGDGNIVEQLRYGAEDIRNFMEFVSKDVGITDQEQKQKSFELLCKEVGSIPIGVAKRSTQLSLSMGEKLLSMHMDDLSKAKAIAEALSSSFFHHGYALNRLEAGKIGLPVVNPDEELENLLWKLWEDIEVEMECRKPFEPLEIVLNDAQATQLVGPVPIVNIPVNIPPQVQQQALQQILQQINVTYTNPINYELLLGTVESLLCRSELRIKGKINAVRMPDMNLAINNINVSQGWTFLDSVV